MKGMMGGKPTKSKDLTSSNMYSVLTILATLMLIPGGLFFEGSKVRGWGYEGLGLTGVWCWGCLTASLHPEDGPRPQP